MENDITASVVEQSQFISASAYLCLQAIHENNQTINDILDYFEDRNLRLKYRRLNYIIEELENKNLVTTRPDLKDARRVIFELTNDGFLFMLGLGA